MNFNIDIVEKDLEDFLCENISKHYKNIKIIKRQFRTKAGVIDLLAKDIDSLNEYIVIELKIGDLTSDSVCQVLRYTQYLNSEMSKGGKRTFHPLLIGSNLSDELSKLLSHYEGFFLKPFYCHYDLFNIGMKGLELGYYNRKNGEFLKNTYQYQYSAIEDLENKLEGKDIEIHNLKKELGGKDEQ